MEREMLGTALIEDLNRLACPAEQERFADDPERARHALDRLRFIDTSEIERYGREGWLAREELDLIERFLAFARARMSVIPGDADALAWTTGDPGWQLARERAGELLEGLDAFIDIGVGGWSRHLRG
jgi:hypothetical protein